MNVTVLCLCAVGIDVCRWKQSEVVLGGMYNMLCLLRGVQNVIEM